MLLKCTTLRMCRPAVQCNLVCLVMWQGGALASRHEDVSIGGCVACGNWKCGHQFVAGVRLAPIDSWRTCVHPCVIKREISAFCSHLWFVFVGRSYKFVKISFFSPHFRCGFHHYSGERCFKTVYWEQRSNNVARRKTRILHRFWSKHKRSYLGVSHLYVHSDRTWK